MASPLFELITELQMLNRRDFPATDPTILKPLSAIPLTEGEWLDLDLNQKLVRGGAGTYSMSVYPVHTERGRYDTQAIGKTNVLFFGQFEGRTKIFDGGVSPAAANPQLAGAFTVGTPLMVCTRVNGQRALTVSSHANGVVEVGYVTKPITNGWLYFMRTPSVAVKTIA